MKDKKLSVRLPSNHPIWQEKPGERSKIVKEALRLYYDLNSYLKEINLQPLPQQETAKEEKQHNKEEESVDSRLFNEDFIERMLNFKI